MKIVLIQPKAYKHKPAHVYEPLNLGYLASYLRVHGYDDINVRVAALEAETEIIADASRADIIGITATSPMMTHGRMLAQQIKEVNPSALVVFGGTHPSAVPASTLADKNIDVVVRGEGEITILELVRAVEDRAPLEGIVGLSYRQDGIIVHNQDRDLIRNIDQLPFPARDLILQEKFIERFAEGSGKRHAWVLSSRGCPFHCTFCASHQVWTRSWRFRSPENVVEEIKDLVRKYRLKHINFADDTFTVNRKRCLQFSELLKQEYMNISWACNVHVNTVDREMLKAMKMAGCVEIWIGVESGSSLILQELGKQSSLERIRDVFRWSKEVGLKRHAYLMIGASSESHQTIHETESLVAEIRPDYAAITILTPYPGCPLYEQAKRAGHVDDNQDWSIVDLHFSVTMPTKYMTKQQLSEEHRRLSERFQKYQRKPRLDWLKLFLLVLHKLRTASFQEYPTLIFNFWRYLKTHAW